MIIILLIYICNTIKINSKNTSFTLISSVKFYVFSLLKLLLLKVVSLIWSVQCCGVSPVKIQTSELALTISVVFKNWQQHNYFIQNLNQGLIKE